MLCAALSVDQGHSAPFRFVKPPKLGDRVAFLRRGAPAQATITGVRSEVRADGRIRLLVAATSTLAA